MEAEAQQRIATQESDGSWRWHPTNEKTAILGKAGEAVLGTCAESALLLLKHARVTGNKASREAGLKALEFMKQFSIPRGRTNVGMPDVPTRCSRSGTRNRGLC